MGKHVANILDQEKLEMRENGEYRKLTPVLRKMGEQKSSDTATHEDLFGEQLKTKMTATRRQKTKQDKKISKIMYVCSCLPTMATQQ